MISDLGYGAYFFFSSILVAMGVWSFFFVPETKGISLEEMDILFSQPIHKAVWAQLRGKPLASGDFPAGGRRKSADSIIGEKSAEVGHLEVVNETRNTP